ncbi:MAG: carbohydrate kinase family protein [Christensenellales bacterium]
MADVVALGELLIDFSPAGQGKMGNPVFEANPGGAPANCAAAVARLGGKSAYIGKVGKDFFGELILKALRQSGIDTSGVREIQGVPTTMAFVSIDGKGERNFSFVRKPGADIMLEQSEVSYELIDKAKIFHFGSVSLTDRPVREATLAAAKYAVGKGKLVSYDPNYREPLWPDKDAALQWMTEGLRYAHIVKMSEEEMSLLTGTPQTDVERGARKILESGKKAVYITLGRKGAYYATQKSAGFVEGYKVKAIDTTGCGDAFMGAILFQLCNHPESDDAQMVRFANAVGALCATKYGGIPAMPDLMEIWKYMAKLK